MGARDLPARIPRRERLFRYLTALLSVALLWGIPEAIVRLRQPVLGQYRGILFGNDSNSPLLFQTDPRLHWKLRPGTSVTFLQTPVRINNDGFRGPEVTRSGRTVLCLGDSTPFGWGVAEGASFPARLEELVRSRTPAAPWTVLNAGVPGYSSFQVRLLAGRLLPRWRPDVVVICAGNNDGWPAHESDSSLDRTRRLAAAVEGMVSRSQFFGWAREKFRAQEPRGFIAESLAAARPRVSREEYAENLRAVIRLAARHGVRVVLLSPPVNLYLPPFMASAIPGKETRWRWYLGLIDRIQRGEAAGVVPEIEQALRADPRDVLALWLKGFALLQAGHAAEGRVLLEEALEQHPFPESSKLSYRQVLPRLAAEENVEFLDINAVFLEAAGTAIPHELYLDHCHPSEKGHRLIAERLIPLILRPTAARTEGP